MPTEENKTNVGAVDVYIPPKSTADDQATLLVNSITGTLDQYFPPVTPEKRSDIEQSAFPKQNTSVSLGHMGMIDLTTAQQAKRQEQYESAQRQETTTEVNEIPRGIHV
jgi:hypothetical protein